jgi:hypothetical protein
MGEPDTTAVPKQRIKPPLWSSRGYAVQFSLLWEPRDLWRGLYWDGTADGSYRVYLCLVPCLPIRIMFKPLRKV